MHVLRESEKEQHIYVTYGRQFAAYRWYKPIIVGVLFVIFYVLFVVLLTLGLQLALGYSTGDAATILEYISTGYDDLNVVDWQGSLINLGGVAVMIPALALAAVIVRDRPFSSYSSSRGGWSGKVFFRCLLVAIICVSLPIAVLAFMESGHGPVNKFTIISFVVLTVIGPLQCIAEEYVYRGLLMQTLGSWFRISVVAVILQAVIFAASHPYNMIGKAEIVISGVAFALAAWIGRGVEASAALHVANNMAIFYLVGLDLTKISSEATMDSVIATAIIYGVYVAVIYFISRKTKLFDRVRKNDAARANEKYVEKKRRKAEKKGKTYEPPAGIPLGRAAVPETVEADVTPVSGDEAGKHFAK